MTYQKLLDHIKGMTQEQRAMDVIVISNCDGIYSFPTMVAVVSEDTDTENGFKPDQPLLG